MSEFLGPTKRAPGERRPTQVPDVITTAGIHGGRIVYVEGPGSNSGSGSGIATTREIETVPPEKPSQNSR